MKTYHFVAYLYTGIAKVVSGHVFTEACKASGLTSKDVDFFTDARSPRYIWNGKDWVHGENPEIEAEIERLTERKARVEELSDMGTEQ